MKVVIVEDEPLTAEDLADTLMKLPGEIEVVKMLPSVTEAVDYFSRNSSPDLIFCDIQLGDGESFEIFQKVPLSSPVVFCTAYNDYAVQAFKNNGIDYILKPYTQEAISEAVEKYKQVARDSYTSLQESSVRKYKKLSSLLVNWKDKIIPVKINDIALFRIEYKTVQLISFDNQKYFINYTLDELEDICDKNFYRANRQFLINREVVREAAQHHARKLLIKLKIPGDHEILVGKNKVQEFLNWLRS